MGIVWAPGLQAFKMMGSRAPATPPFGGLLRWHEKETAYLSSQYLDVPPGGVLDLDLYGDVPTK